LPSFQLLSEPRFQCIEKIKTIGETYMAAAGIKPESQVSNKSWMPTPGPLRLAEVLRNRSFYAAGIVRILSWKHEENV